MCTLHVCLTYGCVLDGEKLGGCQSSNSNGKNDKGKGKNGGQNGPQGKCEDPDTNIICVEASNTFLHGTCALPGKKVPTEGFGTGQCRPG